MPRVNLNVPFPEKDDAKALGARWDPQVRCWYVPAEVDPTPFARWHVGGAVVQGRADVRANRFGVAVSDTACWKCGALVPVACLVVAANHQELVFDEDDGVEDWETVGYAAALSYVRDVSPSAMESIRSVAPWLQVAYSRTVGYAYLASACPDCHALQGDFFLHHEPGGAFVPMDAQASGRIRIHWIPTPIQACADAVGLNADWVSNDAPPGPLHEERAGWGTAGPSCGAVSQGGEARHRSSVEQPVAQAATGTSSRSAGRSAVARCRSAASRIIERFLPRRQGVS